MDLNGLQIISVGQYSLLSLIRHFGNSSLSVIRHLFKLGQAVLLILRTAVREDIHVRTARISSHFLSRFFFVRLRKKP